MDNTTKHVRQQGLDKFYTNPNIVDLCLESLNKIQDINNFDLIIEPSAGNGSFLLKLPSNKRIGLDISPDHADIIKHDFFTYFPNENFKNKWKNVPSNIHSLLEVVTNAATCSAWNFKNKMSLLKAELFSFGCKNNEAEVEYNVAMKSAQTSRFIHEEGLAYELAGRHYERLNDTDKALASFQEARRCYKEWGSQRKIKQVADKISKLHC